jgi:type I restriction enzyme, S subunit
VPPKPLLDMGDAQWAIVQAILQQHVPAREVWAFGSRARWTAKEFSDLDLFVAGAAPLGWQVAAALSDAFAESDLPWKVDVVEEATVSKEFKELIERDRVVVQVGEDSLRMIPKWRNGKLGDFIELKRGYDLPQAKRTKGAVPLISSSGLSDYHNTSMVSGPGVVTGRYGTIGQVFYISNDFWPLNTTLYVRDFKGNDPKFIHYFLKTIDFLTYSDKAAVPGVNRNHLHEAKVKVPPIFEQKEIAKCLSIFDDRISLLRETNATLEAIAQALFKSWFVDFDPVRAKMEGRVPEGMDEATALLYPDSFDESVTHKIPKGWRMGTLADLAELNVESWTVRNHPESLPYIDLSDVKDNQIYGVTDYSFSEAPSRARRVLRTGDTIVGTVRPGNRSFAFIQEPPLNLTGSTGFAVLRPKAVASSEFIYLAATDDVSIEHLAHVADGGAYPAVRPDVVAALPCIIATPEILDVFHDAIAPMFRKISTNQKQIGALTNLRDTLLPRLISGQLRLPEARQMLDKI